MLLRCESQGLPQLAVLAKILCLLMVVMCGAVPTTVPSVRSDKIELISLYSTCGRGNVTVMAKVKTAKLDSDNEPYQILESHVKEVVVLGSNNIKLKLYLYAREVGKYLCFNKQGKVVAKKKADEMCLLYEAYHGRYLRYISWVDPTRFLGFKRNGKPLVHPRGNPSCYNFMRYKLGEDDASSSSSISSSSSSSSSNNHPNKIKLHNKKPASATRTSPPRPRLKSLHRSSNSLVQHQERTRHRHAAWRRREHQLRQQQLLLQQQQQQQQQRQRALTRPRHQESKY